MITYIEIWSQTVKTNNTTYFISWNYFCLSIWEINTQLLMIRKAIGAHLHHHHLFLCVNSHLPRWNVGKLILAFLIQANHKNLPAGINNDSHDSDINYASRSPRGRCALTGPAKWWAWSHLDACIKVFALCLQYTAAVWKYVTCL